MILAGFHMETIWILSSRQSMPRSLELDKETYKHIWLKQTMMQPLVAGARNHLRWIDASRIRHDCHTHKHMI